MDLSGNGNNGIIENCEIVPYDGIDSKIIDVPYRRQSRFALLPHKSNGYLNGAWIDVSIRYNQLKYTNEVSKGYSDITKDGLNSCDYHIHNKSRINNYTQIIVAI